MSGSKESTGYRPKFIPQVFGWARMKLAIIRIQHSMCHVDIWVAPPQYGSQHPRELWVDHSNFVSLFLSFLSIAILFMIWNVVR